MTGVGNQNINTGDSVFNDVYIYGKLDYDFSGDNIATNDLDVLGNLTVSGIATFKNDVYFEQNAIFPYLTVLKRFQVGSAGTILSADAHTDTVGVANTGAIHRFQVGGPNTSGSGETADKAFVVTNLAKIGIGTTTPRQKLDIEGTAIVGTGYSFGIGIIQPRQDLDVIGTGVYSQSIGIGNEEPIGAFQSGQGDDSVTILSGINTTITRVGIGTTNPYNPAAIADLDDGVHGPLRLAVEGSISITKNIYDNAGSPGANNWWLRRDEHGIRWVALTPAYDDGIYIQDEGSFLPTDINHNPIGAAQSFSTINFVQSNSLGIGTDTLRPTAGDTSTPAGSGLSTIFTYDLWGYVGAGADAPIYRMTKVGIKNNNPSKELDVTGELHVTDDVDFDSDLNVDGNVKIDLTLDVDGATTLNSTLDVDGDTTLNATLDVDGATTLNNTLDVDGDTTLNATLDVDGATTLNNTLDVDGKTTFNDVTDSTSPTSSSSVQIDGGVGIVKRLNVGGNVDFDQALNVDGNTDLNAALDVDGATTLNDTLDVDGKATFNDTTDATSPTDTASVQIDGGVGIAKKLFVGSNTKIEGTLELDSSLLDINDNISGPGVGQTDYRLSSVGTGVSWRPPGVETDNAIWVTMDGRDTNTGLLEGDAKATIGAAAAIAKEGDTIIIRSGTYVENNPIGLRTDVSVSGEDLRLVTIVPQNRTKDVFHVRRGCLIQNLNFSGPQDDGQGGVSYDHTGCAAVAFPPLIVADQANTGYIALGPANEGPSGRWKSPYVRNSTNFMTGSIGMRIDGNHANAAYDGTNDLGQDLKSFVCDAFTQYNQNGIGVSLTNNAYAQLVSIFTIGCDIGISARSGGQCDLTNSNSSFGNYGLVADGVGATEFTGTTTEDVAADIDVYKIDNLLDNAGNYRKPFDGQGVFFKLSLDNYTDTTATGTLTQPLQLIRNIRVTNGGSGYSQAAPPIVTVPNPQGPEGIIAEFSANVSAAGTISSVDVISSGRNYLPNSGTGPLQSIAVSISGNGSASAEVDLDPILYTVSVATEPTTNVGLTTVTFNEFIPYAVDSGTDVEMVRLSRIITSSHSFEYIGAGTDINKANPFQGGEPITGQEVIAINGGQCPYTSTDQKGNFKIGDGLTVDQTTSTIRGRDFNRAIQAQLTPLILALR